MKDFKKVLFPILLVIIFIVVAGIYFRKSQGLTPIPFNETSTPKAKETKSVAIGSTEVLVEIANSNTERQRGLSDRSSLDKDSGMLFVIDNFKTIPTFWMKDMKISIDIIWILSSSGDVKTGKIIQIDKEVPPPSAGTPDNKLTLYSPKTAVNYVLEVNSGYSDLKGFKVGDTVSIP